MCGFLYLYIFILKEQCLICTFLSKDIIIATVSKKTKKWDKTLGKVEIIVQILFLSSYL